MTTRYINTAVASNGYAVGSDVNDGLSKAAPKLTLAATQTAGANDDIVYINPGTYDQSATTLSLTKGITWICDGSGFGVEITGTNATTLLSMTAASGKTTEINGFKLTFDAGTASGFNFIATANVGTVRARNLLLNGPCTGTQLLDSYRIGTTELYNVHSVGAVPSRIYQNSTSTADSAAKTITIDGFHVDTDATAAGSTIAILINRYVAGAPNTMTVSVKNVYGNMRAAVGLGVNAAQIAVQILSVDDAVVDRVFVTIDAPGATGNDSGIVNILSVTTGSRAERSRVSNVRSAMNAPAGYALRMGATQADSFCNDGVFVNCDVTTTYYGASASNHGICFGQKVNSKAINCKARRFYVGGLHSISDGSRFIRCVFDECYGRVMYSKGAGATIKPGFYDCIVLIRNVAPAEAAAAISAAVQTATNNTDCEYIGNTIVQFDNTAVMKFVDIDASQVASFDGNTYALMPGVTLPANAWEYQASQYQTLATWATAHEVLTFDYTQALAGAVPNFPRSVMARALRSDLGVYPAIGPLAP